MNVSHNIYAAYMLNVSIITDLILVNVDSVILAMAVLVLMLTNVHLQIIPGLLMIWSWCDNLMKYVCLCYVRVRNVRLIFIRDVHLRDLFLIFFKMSDLREICMRDVPSFEISISLSDVCVMLLKFNWLLPFTVALVCSGIDGRCVLRTVALVG